ncbi:MAG: PHP domain-containing protein, partial [Myxococcales bacterium]|nr:PHP domain-containing protein [Myxococcales bacterium]
MFAELWARTNASFLAGASHAEEMVDAARSLGYAALAIADVDEVGGVVRAHAAAKKARQPLIVGAELSLSDFTPIHPRFWGERGRAGTGSAVVLAKNRAGWAQLCRWLTTARTTSPRGEPTLSVSALLS